MPDIPSLPAEFGRFTIRHDLNGEDITKLPDIAPHYGNTMGADLATVDHQLKVGRYRHFEFYCDEPPRLGGGDRYPQPLTYLAAGIGF